jgi:hypothetical protein
MSKVTTPVEEPASASRAEQLLDQPFQNCPELEKSQHDLPSADAEFEGKTQSEQAQFSCPFSGCGKTFSQQYELKSVSFSLFLIVSFHVNSTD